MARIVNLLHIYVHSYANFPLGITQLYCWFCVHSLTLDASLCGTNILFIWFLLIVALGFGFLMLLWCWSPPLAHAYKITCHGKVGAVLTALQQKEVNDNVTFKWCAQKRYDFAIIHT